jgi:hypothetical protein
MTSSRKAKRNRENARKSTGPRTQAGKLRASRNALRHGLASVATLVDAADVDRLSAALAAVSPNTPVELIRVAAQAELELHHLRKVRAGFGRELTNGLEGHSQERAGLLDLLFRNERLDRYERRVLSRRKRSVRDILI